MNVLLRLIAALIEMESMGPSIVRLKGVASKSYLCMNNDGICRVMVSLVDDSYDTCFLVKSFLGWNSKNTPVLVYRLVN